ncbi:MAG: hypothetical protein IJW00_03735 [Clostridia bacterium]|nr:hypothetical protein [Clostridia bacterium]
MKKLICALTTLSLLVMAPCLLTACGEKLPADYVKGTDVVIDNETPFVYDESTVKYYTSKTDGKKGSLDIEYVTYAMGRDKDQEYTYQYIASIFGNKIVRNYTEGGKNTYYTVYSLPDNELFYLSLYMKDGVLYLDKDIYSGLNESMDARYDELDGYIYEQDFPAEIMGDKLPKHCYLDYYSQEEIAKNNERKWSGYYDSCNQINIPHSIYHDRDGVECINFIRCIESVSFDLVRDDGNTYHGYYVYDLYVHENGAGVLYFYHLYYKNWLQQSAFHIIQEETIPLTVEEVASVVDVMVEQDFAHHPTWNPEEFTGMDGSSTDIFAVGNFGGGGYKKHLISMWEPTARYPHYHIRKAIEDLVRAHVTVEEGRIYRPDLYEEYEWMQ